jgi:hypothetical protein
MIEICAGDYKIGFLAFIDHHFSNVALSRGRIEFVAMIMDNKLALTRL